MNTSSRVAMSLCVAVLCGGGLLFSLQTAKGQTPANNAASSNVPPPSLGGPPVGAGGPPSGPPGSSSAPSTVAAGPVTASASGSPTLPQTVGISPAQGRVIPYFVFGGTGNESSYDLQGEQVYGLLRENGVPIPNVLHPDSTAKPSFVIERLIVLVLSPGTNNSNSNQNQNGGPSGPPSGVPGGPPGSVPTSAGANANKGSSDVSRTLLQVQRVVEAEMRRGSGRIGGNHRRKLLYLRNAIVAVEQANDIGGAIQNAVGSRSGPPSGSGGGGGNNQQDANKPNPRDIFFGSARAYARRADLYAPQTVPPAVAPLTTTSTASTATTTTTVTSSADSG